MTRTARLLAGFVATSLLSFGVNAQVDQRFTRMWNAAQEQRPAALTSSARIAPVSEPGTALIVHGIVMDVAGKPAPNIEVFAYHTDRTGHYAETGAADPWRLKGWAMTGPDGRFEFQTIRPAPYPGRDIPAHIHLTLTTRCCGRQFTDLMFDGDPLATTAYRDRFAAAGQHGLYGHVDRRGDGTEEVSYTIRIREHGNF